MYLLKKSDSRDQSLDSEEKNLFFRVKIYTSGVKFHLFFFFEWNCFHSERVNFSLFYIKRVERHSSSGSMPNYIYLNSEQDFQKKSLLLYTDSSLKKEMRGRERQVGVLTLTWYTYMHLPFEVLFRKIWCSNRWDFMRDETAQITRIGCIFSKLCQNAPNLYKIGCFLSKMVWVGNCAKIWYWESQICEVRQAHPCTILTKVPPPGQGVQPI